MIPGGIPRAGFLGLMSARTVAAGVNRYVCGGFTYDKNLYWLDWYGTQTTTQILYIYKEKTQVSSLTYTGGGSGSRATWGGGWVYYGGAIYVPYIELASRTLSCKKYDIAANSWSTPWTSGDLSSSGWTTIAFAFDLTWHPVSHKIYIGVAVQRDGATGRFYVVALNSDGTADHEISNKTSGNEIGQSIIFRLSYDFTTDILEAWRSKSYGASSQYSYAGYIDPDTVSGTFTQRWYTDSDDYVPWQHCPIWGLYFRGYDYILRRASTGRAWALSSYIDLDFNWGILYKVTTNDDYYIFTRKATTIYLLYIQNNDAVTVIDSKACSSSFDYDGRFFQCAWTRNYSPGVLPETNPFFGSGAEMHYMKGLPWREVI